jgi:hypothetical protein
MTQNKLTVYPVKCPLKYKARNVKTEDMITWVLANLRGRRHTSSGQWRNEDYREERESTRRKTLPVSVPQTQISYEIAWHWTQGFALKGQCLTTWTIPRLLLDTNCKRLPLFGNTACPLMHVNTTKWEPPPPKLAFRTSGSPGSYLDVVGSNLCQVTAYHNEVSRRFLQSNPNQIPG